MGTTTLLPTVQIMGSAQAVHVQCLATTRSWSEVWQELVFKLQALPHLTMGSVEFATGQWALDIAQLQTLAHLLSAHGLRLDTLKTCDRNTAIAAASLGYAVMPEPAFMPQTPWQAPLYLETTIRSGTRIDHPGSVILKGDVNPGGEIIASGDIIIWGRLRGVAHAGATGQESATIMALSLQASQIRIAHQVARVPPTKLNFPTPELACLEAGEIHIKRV